MIGSTSDNTGQTIQLDRTFEFDTSLNYWITYENPSGEGVITRGVSGFGLTAGLTIVQIDDNADVIDVPVTNSIYVLTSSTDSFRLFRVIANKEQKGQQFEITAVQHDPAKYDQIDQAQTLVSPGGNAYGSWPVAAVQNLTSSTNTYVDHGSNKSDITLSWSPPPSPNPADAPGTFDARVTGYDIFWNGGGGWTKVSSTISTTFTQVDVAAGDYIFMVRAVTPSAVGPWTSIDTGTTSGQLPAPSTPNNLTANIGYNQATIYWDQVTSTGTKGYYIYKDYVYLSYGFSRPFRTGFVAIAVRGCPPQ